jgi:hypothetical protein
MNALKIREIAIAAVERRLPGFPTSAGWCVAFAFECVARAYDTNRWVLYNRILDRQNADPDRSRWALDVELAVQRPLWAISKQDFNTANATERKKLLELLKPGDLLFSSKRFDEAPTTPRVAQDIEGHIGIFIGDYGGVQSVAENTRADRGVWFGRKNALRITPLERWDAVTTVARIPGNWRP